MTAHGIFNSNEYMQIYPHISYYSDNERYSNGEKIKEGYYVCTNTDTGRIITPLRHWLTR